MDQATKNAINNGNLILKHVQLGPRHLWSALVIHQSKGLGEHLLMSTTEDDPFPMGGVARKTGNRAKLMAAADLGLHELVQEFSRPTGPHTGFTEDLVDVFSLQLPSLPATIEQIFEYTVAHAKKRIVEAGDIYPMFTLMNDPREGPPLLVTAAALQDRKTAAVIPRAVQHLGDCTATAAGFKPQRFGRSCLSLASLGRRARAWTRAARSSSS